MTGTSENPSIMSHVSIGVADFASAVAFYDAVLGSMGIRKIMSHKDAVAYGRDYPEFWVQIPQNGKAPSVGNGSHIGFFARSKDEVHGFWETALARGATPEGKPGPRPHYGESYYGCFLRDLDGHKIEAAFWDAELMK
uniref:VOC family protein n=1 Tax=Pararhizobium sp. IMCC3301 TaxID=3067904 RepID=UPI0027429923|nr:VOC family protein [Pararhizobium sp. IMCC3301]